jgi:hypothetical protein
MILTRSRIPVVARIEVGKLLIWLQSTPWSCFRPSLFGKRIAIVVVVVVVVVVIVVIIVRISIGISIGISIKISVVGITGTC